jgi:hypothetical protein
MEIVASSDMTADEIGTAIDDHIWDIMNQQIDINVREALVTTAVVGAPASDTPENNPGMLYFGGHELPPTIQHIPLAYRRAALDWVDMIHQQDGVLKLANLLATLAGVMK